MNIRNDDIADGNPKLTLGLIWTIILHFQVVRPPTCPLPPAESAGRGWPLEPPVSLRCSPALPPRPGGPGLSQACLSLALWPWLSLQKHAFSAVWPPATGKVLERHPLLGLTHPLPAQPHRKPQI